jgi:hypothetical protein
MPAAGLHSAPAAGVISAFTRALSTIPAWPRRSASSVSWTTDARAHILRKAVLCCPPLAIPRKSRSTTKGWSVSSTTLYHLSTY